jgi:hypothetical protein
VLPPSSGRWYHRRWSLSYVKASTLHFYISSLLFSWDHRPDDGGSTYLWNVGRHSIKNTAVHPRRFWASYSPPWEPENVKQENYSLHEGKKKLDHPGLGIVASNGKIYDETKQTNEHHVSTLRGHTDRWTTERKYKTCRMLAFTSDKDHLWSPRFISSGNVTLLNHRHLPDKNMYMYVCLRWFKIGLFIYASVVLR